jgi:acyl-CoA synthetase (NDP forming)
LRIFERLATEAKRLNKPIVAIKAGRSDQARAAAVSHTASLTGSAEALAASLAKFA